jgi:hypothetical protein
MYLPYILESNPHPGFGDYLNGKKLVCDSNPHLFFDHPLPTGRLINPLAPRDFVKFLHTLYLKCE